MAGWIRLLVVVIVGAACVGGWWYLAQRETEQAKTVAAVAAQPSAPEPPPRPDPAACGGLDAVYTARENKGLTIRWARWDEYLVPASLSSQVAPEATGALTMVVSEPSGQKHRFAVLGARGYMRSFAFPLQGNRVRQTSSMDLIELIQLDQTYEVHAALPVENSRAYQTLFLPGLARFLHPASRRGGQTIVGNMFFDFTACEPAASDGGTAGETAPEAAVEASRKAAREAAEGP